MYTLKSVARRSTFFGAAVAVFAATVVPAAPAFADALNPLTERSLLLSSSAPGYADTDGSGNSAESPNSVNTNYAPAGSGPNGKKSGQTFTFTHTSTATIKGFSLQYCTTAAGLCQAPGNNTGDARGTETDPGPPPVYDGVSTRQTNAVGHLAGTSDLEFVESNGHIWDEAAIPAGPLTPLGAVDGQFQVIVDGVVQSGWEMTAANLESQNYSGALTGKDNYITLVNDADTEIASGDVVEIRFRPSEDVYITNPGSDEFFVKINTYNSDTDLIGNHNDSTPNDQTDHTVVDGGVTVANVMTESIHITTKVLETMSFSVGIQNRDTVDIGSGQRHGKCDPILTAGNGTTNNRLNLGNPNAEYSLETGRAWDVNSYWRLSSNSSGGASVYYSGDTLRNTVGDSIAEMDDSPAVASTPGQEQFGLGFVDAGADTLDTGAATWANTDSATHANLLGSYPFITLAGQNAETTPQDYSALGPQTASADYSEATGSIFIDPGGGNPIQPGTAKFKFLSSSLTVPELIAQQDETVISCSTAKMRYVANIGADTPAGVYTTKINYLAAPQY